MLLVIQFWFVFNFRIFKLIGVQNNLLLIKSERSENIRMSNPKQLVGGYRDKDNCPHVGPGSMGPPGGSLFKESQNVFTRVSQTTTQNS